jgi:hypothetical protein
VPKRILEDEGTILSILEKTPVGVLATCAGEEPWAVPMNFVYDAGSRRVYLHSGLKGRKLENIRANPRVSFLVYVPGKLAAAEKACEFGQRYQSVILSGRARIVDENEEKRRALEQLVAKYAGGRKVEPPADEDLARVAVIAIEVERVSGKENVAPELLSEEDPIWKLTGAGNSGFKDVAAKHDHYLAEGEVQRWRE